MPAFYNTTDRIHDALSNLLQLATDADLPAQYDDTIITDSRQAANNEIYAALLDRGYSEGQIQDWDRGAEFERDIALFWCLVKGGGLNVEDARMVALDRRKELATVAVTVGGSLVDAGDFSGVIAVGLLNTEFTESPLQFVRTTSPSGVSRIPW